MAADVLLERDGCVATVTLFNPGKLNAINAAMWRRLAAVMTEVDADCDLRAVVVRGNGTAFAAGGDLNEFHHERADSERALAYHKAVGAALQAVALCRHPTVALLLGPCIGGGLEIACACDLRIAGESVRLGAPINKLGFSMYPGELAYLLQLAGPAVAKEILLEGRLLTAPEGYEKGLVTRIVPDASAEIEAYATARRIADGAPLAARAHKRWITRLLDGRPLSEEEKHASFAFLDTDDYREGLDAFKDKRRPVFKGR
ncbi:MAG TPA: enoyl-CoA hydratase-related protein [Rhodocyclaceae bacterium]|nr:enoyl-CoA hydratase-related protein [Rhodocyclaceae bacterium]